MDAELLNRTREIPPDRSAEIIVAWHDGYKRLVEATPMEVTERPRVYPFWMPERRKEKRA